MKKTIAIVLSAILLIAAVAMTSFALTQNGDWYEIATADDLIEFATLATANGARTATRGKLVDDIDMTGKTWTPMGTVAVEFDGQGHTISNITYESNATNGGIGLFATSLSNGGCNSHVYNVTFKDCTFTATKLTGASMIGFVAGNCNRGGVTDVTLDNVTMTVANTLADGEFMVGFLTGRDDWQQSGDYSYLGADIKSNCTLNVTANTANNRNYIGGFLGACSSTKISISDSKMDGVITSNVPAYAYVSQTWCAVEVDATVTTTSTLAKFPAGASVSEKIGVATADEYIAAVEMINNGAAAGGFTLTADLDFAGKDFPTITAKFVGIVEGNGHTIKNITLTKTDVSGDVGIVGNLLSNGGGNGTVRNLTIADSNITVTTNGNATVGVFGGKVDRGFVTNCKLVNTKFTVNGGENEVYVGGIAGLTTWGNSSGDRMVVAGCSTDKDTVITVTGIDTNVGGIVGRHDSNLLDLQNCVNSAAIIGEADVAGLAAYVQQNVSTMSNCANYGPLTGKTVAGAVAKTNAANPTVNLTNVTISGVLTGSETVYGYGPETVAAGDGCTTSYISNPLATDSCAAFYQTTAPIDGKASYRILIVADLNAFASLNIPASSVVVDMVFTTANGTKTHTQTLAEYGVYKQVSAGNSVYKAAEGDCIFGCVITDVPVAEIQDVDVVITAGDTTIYTTVAAE